MKYTNLCELCDNPRTCNQHDRFNGIHGAILCLEEKHGDIAWISKVEAVKYYTVSWNFEYFNLTIEKSIWL